MEPLEEYRRFFARYIAATAQVAGASRLVEAFALTPREKFLGPGPWKVQTNSGYIETPSDNPLLLYQNFTVALLEEQEVNNGVPSLHALAIAALALEEGQTVVQVGAGTGYYTAILARLVGPAGTVHAYEIREQFHERLEQNLADLPQVKIHLASGAAGELPGCDAVYVNASATAPHPSWLQALHPMGRLIFPLTPAEGSGGMLLLIKQRIASAPARFLCPARFTPCIGGREEVLAQRLTAAFEDPRWREVQSYRCGQLPDGSCWFADGQGWYSTRPLLPEEDERSAQRELPGGCAQSAPGGRLP